MSRTARGRPVQTCRVNLPRRLSVATAFGSSMTLASPVRCVTAYAAPGCDGPSRHKGLPRVAIVGELDPMRDTQHATVESLAHASVRVDTQWISTDCLDDPAEELGGSDGIWMAPGGQYRSVTGALAAICFARERDVPSLGTCGGFQHVVIEYARNVVGLRDATHAAVDASAEYPVMTPLACGLTGSSEPVRILPGTRAESLYERRTPSSRSTAPRALTRHARAAHEARPRRLRGRC